MIEVEKKFILTEKEEKSLTTGAEFLGEKTFIDIYYDDENYSLTGKDIWLRKRSDRFELKIPLNLNIKERISDQYREIENDEDILKYFNANINEPLESFLINNKYFPFCEIKTTRRKYKKDGFNIDLDLMDFGYKLAEIEYMISNEAEMEQATKSILEFAKSCNIDTKAIVKGKVIEYLRLNDPKHFQTLIDLEVVKEDKLSL